MNTQLLPDITKKIISKLARNIVLLLIIVPLLVSCNSNTQQTSSRQDVEKNSVVIPEQAEKALEEQPEVENEEYSAESSVEFYDNGDTIVLERGIKRGLVLKGDYKYYGFINEEYCKLADDGFTLELNSYSLTDAIEFPEDMPIGTSLAYSGYVNFMDIIKDEAGNRIEIICIDAKSKDSYGKETTQLLGIARYESDIEKKKNTAMQLLQVRLMEI